LISTSTEKDDQLEELQGTLRHLESQNERLQQVVETSSHERTTSAKTTEALGHEIAEVRNLLEAKTLLCCQKEDEVKRLLTENNDLQTELDTVQTVVGRLSH
jgi:GTPase involved in cell partitioning and DNA repair